ncbi:MAG: geranylgeranyl reductase family protein [Candidatus Bathyarchaeia archaeon]|nr:NAD(P)/FAD-dependent oxidoreductase [Candidatus Bathyarchaeota archaeon A05DMB-4]MDH7594847.1 NAD(P)/FAD-dependent oxidoreductase [Candidatus Bathyarchaeota archaeon]
MTVKSDVVVIGAGPCGSFSALAVARSGVKVSVFEEHSSVGVPCHCAGHLSLKGMQRLGLKSSPLFVENLFKNATFFSPSGTRFCVCSPSQLTCVVNRKIFDQRLADIATRSGAEYFFNSRVKSLLRERGVVKGIVFQRQNKIEKVYSKIVIDAEGVASTVLKNAGLKPLNRKLLVKAVSATVDDVRDVEIDGVEVYFGKTFADGFYAWIIPKRDGTAKIGLATKRNNPKNCLEYFVRKHKIASGKLGRSKILGLSYHAIPLGGPISKTYADGFLAVGDVASQVKPTTGGGVTMGLTCARIAGKVAAQAVKGNDFSEDFLNCYEVCWRREIGFDMRIMVFVRKLLNRLSDHEIDKLFRVAARLRLNEALARVEDVDFQGNTLLHLIKNPSTVAALAYFFFSALA